MGANGEPGRAGTRSGVPAAARANARVDDPPSELDLEGVVAGRTRCGQRRLRSATEALRIRAGAGQPRLRGSGTPRLGCHAAQRESRLGNDPVLDAQAGRRRNHGKGVGGALAELEVTGMRREPRGSTRQANGHDQFAGHQHALALRSGAGQQVEFFEPHLAPARLPLDFDHGVERGERHAEIGRMRGDAGLAPTQDSVQAVLAAARVAARTRLPLVAAARRVIEIGASRALQQVPADRRGVAQLG